MSLQKRSEAYARHMDEVFREDARDYDLEYREYQYLQQHKPAPTGAQNQKKDERPENDKQA